MSTPVQSFDYLYDMLVANYMVGVVALSLLVHIACGILIVVGAVLPSWVFVRHGGMRGFLFVAALWVLALRIAYQ